MNTQTVSVGEDIRARKKAAADAFRQAMAARGTFVVRLLSSPGSGKTTLLQTTAKTLGEKYRVGILVGDVCGHGLGPALHMIGARGALRALMNSSDSTGWITTQANKIVQRDTRHGRFITLLFVLLNPETRRLSFSSAGHPGFVFDSSGRLKETLKSGQPPLGLF